MHQTITTGRTGYLKLTAGKLRFAKTGLALRQFGSAAAPQQGLHTEWQARRCGLSQQHRISHRLQPAPAAEGYLKLSTGINDIIRHRLQKHAGKIVMQQIVAAVHQRHATPAGLPRLLPLPALPKSSGTLPRLLAAFQEIIHARLNPAKPAALC